MQTPFELNLQKLSLEALHDERERNRQRDLDIENEIQARKQQATSDTVKRFVEEMKSHGFAARDTIAAVKAVYDGETPELGASKPRSAAPRVAKPARGNGPRVGATYVHPTDASQTWTKKTALGAPARWLSRLVAESEHKSYEPFEKKD